MSGKTGWFRNQWNDGSHFVNPVSAVMLISIVLFSILVPSFMTKDNWEMILRQFSFSGMLAIGMAMVVIAGGIDLSVGGQLAVDGMMLAHFLVLFKGHVMIAMLITLVMGAATGCVNGIFCAAITSQFAPLATFGTLMIMNGIVYTVFSGSSIYGLPEGFLSLWRGFHGMIPNTLPIMIGLAGLCFFVMENTYWGRYVYCVGGNPTAAEGLGISRKIVWPAVYTWNGVMVTVAAMMLAGYNNSVIPAATNMYVFDSLLACGIGHISFAGGEGRLLNLLSATLCIVVWENGFSAIGFRSNEIGAMKGFLLLIVLCADFARSKRYDRKMK